MNVLIRRGPFAVRFLLANGDAPLRELGERILRSFGLAASWELWP